MSNPWKLTSKAMLGDGLKELRKCACGSANFTLLPGEAECILHEITRLREQVANLQVDGPKPNRVVVELREPLSAQAAIMGIRAVRPDEACIIAKGHDDVVVYGLPGGCAIGQLNTIKEEA